VSAGRVVGNGEVIEFLPIAAFELQKQPQILPRCARQDDNAGGEEVAVWLVDVLSPSRKLWESRLIADDGILKNGCVYFAPSLRSEFSERQRTKREIKP
jgi:hypothetical protein